MKLMEINDFKRRDVHSTLRETSKDKSNNEYVSECRIKVIDFDKVKTKYWSSLGVSDESSKSVDALVDCKDDKICFVEFKNGAFNGREIREKIKDSLLIFNQFVGWQLEKDRAELVFVLVYNGEVKRFGSRTKLAKKKAKRASIKYDPYGLFKMEGSFFCDVEVCEKAEFESSEIFNKFVALS